MKDTQKAMPKKSLHQLALEFWLPLPLIALSCWFGLSWLSQKVLGQAHEPDTQLSTYSQQEIVLSLSLTVTSIDAEIDRELGVAEVTVQTIGSPLQELEFEYPFVEYAEIENAIATELGLSEEVIRALIRYRINY